jgi:hypothetical protein
MPLAYLTELTPSSHSREIAVEPTGHHDYILRPTNISDTGRGRYFVRVEIAMVEDSKDRYTSEARKGSEADVATSRVTIQGHSQYVDFRRNERLS